MKLASLILSAILAIALSSCEDNLPSKPDPNTIKEFRSITWKLASIESNGQTQTIAPATSITIQFSDDSFIGHGPCDIQSGRYSVNNDAMTITNFAAGNAQCNQESLRDQYETALKGVESYLSTGLALRLYSDGGRVVLNYVKSTDPAPGDTTNPLAGTKWELVAFEMRGVIAPVYPERPVTLELSSNSSAFAGDGPCNQYGGNYVTQPGSKISFKDLHYGRMLCADSSMERSYFDFLSRGYEYRVTDTSLQIVHDQGVLHFRTFVPGTHPPPNTPLPNTKWRLLSVTTNTDAEIVSHAVTLDFYDHETYAGLGGCNDYTGEYIADGSNITFGLLTSFTQRCVYLAFEIRYFDYLQSAVRYISSDSSLRIITSTGTVLTYGRRASDPALPRVDSLLVDAIWQLKMMSSRGMVVFVPNTVSTIEFKSGGAFSGFGICNNFGGEYTATRPQISITSMVATEIACQDGGNEGRYFEALQNAYQYVADRENLSIQTQDGYTLYYERQ